MSTAFAPADGCPSGLAPPEGAPSYADDLSAFVGQDGRLSTLDLSVRGAKCGGCLAKIEKAVGNLDGVKTARLNLSTGRMRVGWSGALQANTIAETIRGLGYGVSAHSPDTAAIQSEQEEKRLLAAIGVAGFAMANIMLLSVSVWAGHGDMGASTRQMLHGISGLIAFPALLYAGQHFFRSAWSALRGGHVNMDVPISLALVLAFSTSVWETFASGPHAYFDACMMLLFFLLIGRYLDARLRRRAYAAAHDLAALQNRSLTRIDSAGHASAVRAEEVRAGDTILLAPGERALVDLQISAGSSEIDESLVSGESLPRLAAPGTKVFAGSVNLGAALTGHAISSASNSLLSDISQMLETGKQRKSAYRKLADRAVSLYVPFVHTTAALAFMGWLILGASVQTALMIAVATLIITCPCALALAAPVTQVVAASRLFRSGVFLKSGDALERLAEIDHVIFDKTGTLTLGEPLLISDPESEAALVDAAALARTSRHPLSRALVAAAGAGEVAENTRETPGLGLEGDLRGENCRLGSAVWVGVEDEHAASGPRLWFVRGGAQPVCFRFEDHIEQGAKETLAELKAQSLSFEILSGDKSSSVQRIAENLQIEHWTAEATPAGKAAHLEALRAQGREVLMVGDGLNDAGALSLAHASLAPGGAMDISQAASDAVYARGLGSIPFILSVARRARTTMKQNFALAAGYNLIAVPIAVTGHVTPLIAAIAMSASSLIVTLNALRMTGGRY